ncbi:unnamed protein product [Didymodactylos carnosus]|uniref:DUF4166 domain-containing protein n=1 Tax=Didymodactylos carnosus TaxID=1234261 RepID=A0A814GTA5_9BILA|nr:unnamed protein product [Didymodactylos carnosus]CAF1373034.1 unnamed protein product [Didymodactylos carnosus]CAF3772512.1 unnamed protein product [Didymodactylos carnosus]CAF4181927.1 unnamed protein product [Didymodactylos carnosus]
MKCQRLVLTNYQRLFRRTFLSNVNTNNVTINNNPGLYGYMLGSEFKAQPKLLQLFHSVQAETSSSIVHFCSGSIVCHRGSGLLAKLISRLGGAPPPMKKGSVYVEIQQSIDGQEEIWTRTFVDDNDKNNKKTAFRFQTIQYLKDDHLIEIIGNSLSPIKMQFVFKIQAVYNNSKTNECIGFDHILKSVHLSFGNSRRFLIKLPKVLQPLAHGETRIDLSDSKSWNLKVELFAPNLKIFSWFMNDKRRFIGGYEGHINRFSKSQIQQLYHLQQQSQQDHPIMILGGFGLFGARIASALLAENYRVIVVSRKNHPVVYLKILQQAQKHSKDKNNNKNNLQILLFDVNQLNELSLNIERSKSKIVINCCGPFQSKTAREYRIAHICLQNLVHYIDLADSREFIINFTKQTNMNAHAKEAQICMVTGASTVPGLSTTVIAELNEKYFHSIDTIEIGISPGNETSRSLATIQSILSGVGKPLKFLNLTVYGWQSLKQAKDQFHVKLNNNHRRFLSAVDVPDLDLLPLLYPTIKSVEFRAGLELDILHLGLWLCSWFVRAGLIQDLSYYSKLMKYISELSIFTKFGSDRGGMFVQIRGTDINTKRDIQVIWQIYAGSGDGPQIPATAAVILVDKILTRKNNQTDSTLKSGAYACVNLFTIEEYMSKLRSYDIEANVRIDMI